LRPWIAKKGNNYFAQWCKARNILHTTPTSDALFHLFDKPSEISYTPENIKNSLRKKFIETKEELQQKIINYKYSDENTNTIIGYTNWIKYYLDDLPESYKKNAQEWSKKLTNIKKEIDSLPKIALADSSSLAPVAPSLRDVQECGQWEEGDSHLSSPISTVAPVAPKTPLTKIARIAQLREEAKREKMAELLAEMLKLQIIINNLQKRGNPPKVHPSCNNAYKTSLNSYLAQLVPFRHEIENILSKMSEFGAAALDRTKNFILFLQQECSRAVEPALQQIGQIEMELEGRIRV
jgi:NADH:ubiquinone oxidoreductase subunit